MTQGDNVIDWDEVQHNVEGRYVNSSKAAWEVTGISVDRQITSRNDSSCTEKGEQGVATQRALKFIDWFSWNSDATAHQYIYLKSLALRVCVLVKRVQV